jgi:UDP-2-acetamido-3-amino-2,3-dideoxy-glucuronate N-acetyltransferase
MMAGAPRVAQLGVGYWGKNLARNFAETGALAAIMELNPALSASASATLGVPAISLDDALADPAIDAISIATRAETHFTFARRALQAGKHVFVEKPLVLDPAEADALIALAAEKERVLMVGHLLRYHPKFAHMLELVRSGQYGPMRYVYSDRLSLGKIRTEENVLWSFAPHDISMILALAGEEPISVTAQGKAIVDPSIEDWSTVQLAFPSGVRGEIRTSWLHYAKVQKIVAVCRDASIVFEDSAADWERKLAVHPYAVTVENGIPVPKRGEVIYPDTPFAEPLKLECQHFISCIAENRVPLTDASEGKAVLKVLQAAETSMKANSPCEESTST